MEYKKVFRDEVLIGSDEYGFTHFSMVKQVTLDQDGSVVNVRVRDWQGLFLPDEPVTVSISGPGVEPVTEICSDGTIELVGEAGQKLLIVATLSGADEGRLEVTL